MSQPDQINFGSYALFVDSSLMGGVQSLSLSSDYQTTDVPSYGLLTNKVYYGKPNISLSFERFLSNNVEPFIITGSGNVPSNSGYLIQYYGINGFEGIKKYKLEVSISSDSSDRVLASGTSIVMNDFVVQGLSYRFETEGNFTETVELLGHAMNEGTGSIPTSGNREGTVKRRQDFSLAETVVPHEVSGMLSGNHVLKSVDVAVNFNWNEIPNFGFMESYKNKVLSLPIDITCSFTVLDRGFNKDLSNYYGLTGKIYDNVYYITSGNPTDPIKIVAGGFVYDLGSGNYLQSIERSSPNAGDSTGFATYTYTYKNSNNYFKLLRK